MASTQFVVYVRTMVKGCLFLCLYDLLIDVIERGFYYVKLGNLTKMKDTLNTLITITRQKAAVTSIQQARIKNRILLRRNFMKDKKPVSSGSPQTRHTT